VRAAAAPGLAVALALAVGVVLAGCGGESDSAKPSEASGKPPADSLEALWRGPGEDVTIVPGAQDFEPGRVRLPFLVVDGEGRVVSRPTARVWLARGLREAPFAETTARLEQIGTGGDAHDADPTEIFVAQLDVAEPGKYWLLAEPVGGRRIQALGNLVVAKESVAPGVGDPAPASETPTLDSTGGHLAALTTQSPPDRELLQYSVADSLAAHAPFVVAFATPRYCTSRVCGPVVDVVDAVRRRYLGSGVRFIHVEIYEGNNPDRGFNRWVKEWRLPSEPFVFLVGRDGLIRERFEGTVSVRELAAAVKRDLLR
jgi:hypothetical protein